MTSAKKLLVPFLTVLVLASPWLVSAGPAAGTERGTPAAQPATSAASRFHLKSGVVFNNPHRRAESGKIIYKIKRAIRHVPKRHKIWIMTWNFQAPGITRALIKAHKRGVSVRLIMSRSLAWNQGRKGSYRVLTRALKKGDKSRPGHLKSFTRTCKHSCRGRGASMHAKLMLLSKVGASRNVVMHGSANFTTSAASKQWNDWYTIPNNRGIYKGWKRIFRQSLRDRPAKPVQFTRGHVYSWFAPRTGSTDPVMDLLRKVTCWGARGAGIRGHTGIRVAQAVWQDRRGLRIAKKLKRMHRANCNVRVVFTMMSPAIRRVLRGVPTRQLVYDWNRDGAYDRYLHMKAMTINGRFGKDRSHRLVFNGAANWSSMGIASDEQGMVIRSRSREKQYRKHINWLFNNAPRHLRPVPSFFRARGLQDPYEGLELELAGQG